MGPEIFSPVKAHLATLAIYTWNLILSTSPSSSSCLLQARHRIWPPMPRQLAGAPCPPARRPRLLAGCRERRRPRLAACSPAPPALPLLAQPRRRLSLVPPAPSRRSRRLLARAPAAPPRRACRPAPGAACGRPAPHPAPRMAGGGAEAGHAPHAGAVVRRSFGGASNLILCC